MAGGGGIGGREAAAEGWMAGAGSSAGGGVGCGPIAFVGSVAEIAAAGDAGAFRGVIPVIGGGSGVAAAGAPGAETGGVSGSLRASDVGGTWSRAVSVIGDGSVWINLLSIPWLRASARPSAC